MSWLMTASLHGPEEANRRQGLLAHPSPPVEGSLVRNSAGTAARPAHALSPVPEEPDFTSQYAFSVMRNVYTPPSLFGMDGKIASTSRVATDPRLITPSSPMRVAPPPPSPSTRVALPPPSPSTRVAPPPPSSPTRDASQNAPQDALGLANVETQPGDSDHEVDNHPSPPSTQRDDGSAKRGRTASSESETEHQPRAKRPRVVQDVTQKRKRTSSSGSDTHSESVVHQKRARAQEGQHRKQHVIKYKYGHKGERKDLEQEKETKGKGKEKAKAKAKAKGRTN